MSECDACKREEYRKANPDAIIQMNALKHTCERVECEFGSVSAIRFANPNIKILNDGIQVHWGSDEELEAE